MSKIIVPDIPAELEKATFAKIFNAAVQQSYFVNIHQHHLKTISYIIAASY
jgi:hypothetical protein